MTKVLVELSKLSLKVMKQTFYLAEEFEVFYVNLIYNMKLKLRTKGILTFKKIVSITEVW